MIYIGIFAVLYLVLCYRLALIYIHPARISVLTPPWVSEQQIDGKSGPIPIWSSPRLAKGEGKPVVLVLAHGYGGTRQSWYQIMQELPPLGYECVAPAMPGQDANPAKSVGFGYPEAQTIVDTVKWVRSKYKKPPKIVLWGVSMGAAASWLASEMDPSVDGVIAEGAYGTFDDTLTHWLGSYAPGAGIYLKPMVWMASAMDHIDPAKIRPVDSAAKWKKPALVIQAGDDRLIERSQADMLSKAAGCPLWVVPGAAHAECWEAAHDEYLRRVEDFVRGLTARRATASRGARS